MWLSICQMLFVLLLSPRRKKYGQWSVMFWQGFRFFKLHTLFCICVTVHKVIKMYFVLQGESNPFLCTGVLISGTKTTVFSIDEVGSSSRAWLSTIGLHPRIGGKFPNLRLWNFQSYYSSPHLSYFLCGEWKRDFIICVLISLWYWEDELQCSTAIKSS